MGKAGERELERGWSAWMRDGGGIQREAYDGS